MKNPYEVLGVSENATDEEIKTAYRNLAKKYHPDNYQDSPLADLAEEKMKEVNEAYDNICDMRKNGGGAYRDANGYGSSASGSYASGSSYTRTNYPDVRSYLNSGRIDDAMAILNGVAVEKRDAEWFFLMGIAFSRKGWSEQATMYLREAYKREPNNPEYAAAVRNMNQRRTYNNSGYNTYSGSDAACDCCGTCAAMMCAECLCNMCCHSC